MGLFGHRMVKEKRIFFLFLLLVSGGGISFAQEKKTSLTLFRNNLALVKIESEFSQETSLLSLTLPLTLIPESLSFWSSQGETEEMILAPPQESAKLLSLKLVLKKARGKFRLLYLCRGIKWNIYWLAHFSSPSTLQLEGWVRIINGSGMGFKNVNLQIVDKTLEEKNMENFSLPLQKNLPFSYTLPSLVSLFEGEERRFRLIFLKELPIQEIYLFDGERYGNEVRRLLEFKNPSPKWLPQGEVYIYRETLPGEEITLVGKDRLLPIPEGEKGTIYLGEAVGIKGERILTGFEPEKPSQAPQKYTYTIILSNLWGKEVKVRVIEHLYEGKELVESNPPPSSRKGNLLFYEIRIPPGEKREIVYTGKSKG